MKIVVIGTGLAGLSCTLQLLKKGLPVVLLEKTSKFGGNSIKASSGINGANTIFQPPGDSAGLFLKDTLASGQGLCNEELAKILTERSSDAISWLSQDIGVDLLEVTRLGGHSFPRTHRGKGKLPPGFAIVSELSKALETFRTNKQLTVLLDTSLKSIVMSKEKSRVIGIEYEAGGKVLREDLDYLILATGGFAADHSKSSLLDKFRPDLVDLPLTNGDQTTGDGQKIAARDVDANLIQMDEIQVHPTGFLDIEDPTSVHKILCGELIRGIGGILISPNTGKRFVNELTTRDRVTKEIQRSCQISKIRFTAPEKTSVALILVNDEDYLKAKNHIDFYVSKGLMRKGTVMDIVDYMKLLSEDIAVDARTILATLDEYNAAIAQDSDSFGRPAFGHEFDGQTFYFGFITPVLHFTMGGIEINRSSQVITRQGNAINNMYAIGEVAGGVHGANRLGGNSLLECVVFATIVSNLIANESK